MEGGEDASEEPAYVTTTAESPSDVLRIQVDMVDDDRGGMWCVHGDGGQEDVSMVATRLRRLDDIGNREDFHRQCCEVSCCTAKEVIQIMHSGAYKVSLVQIASEIFLLQNLLNPTHYSCTEELLDSWLSIQEDKDQGTSAILENVNKMVALVESVEHLVIFLRSLLKRFGMRFLGLCSDLALRALKQQHHLAAGEGSEIGDSSNRQKLSQTLDLVGQMYFDTHRQLSLACLLSALYVEPTDRRYFALEIGFTKPSDATAAADIDCIQISNDVLADLLHTVDMFRPAELDLDLGWLKLKPFVTDLLFRAGYHYEPMNNMFSDHSTGKASSDLGTVAVDDSSWIRATQPDGSQATQRTADRSWCSIVNSSDFSSSFVDGKKPCSAGDVSDLSIALWSPDYCGVKIENVMTSAGRNVLQANGSSLDVMSEVPDSTSIDVAVSSSNKESRSGRIKTEYLGSNGSLDSNGIGSSRGLEVWKGTRAWPALDSDDEASNPLNIASAEEEDASSIAEEVPVFESSSAFSKKRSASAEMMSSSQLAAEPSRKRRAVSISRSKSLRQSQDDKGAETTVDAAAECILAKDVSSCKRTLRPKDRFDHSRVVTRKTFCFRYKYSFSSKVCTEETGKRSVSESDASKSKISVPNGIKLKNCFIRLNRVKTEAEQSQPEENNESGEEVRGSASLIWKEVQSTGSAPLTPKEEQSTGCGSLTLKQEQSTAASVNLKEVQGSTLLPLKEAVKQEAEETRQEGIVIKEEAAAAAEEKVVQCVCDGCGEIVPDCSWLTAHIVTCTGRPESGVPDAMMDDELTNTFQSDTPIWDAMGGGGGTVNDGALDTIAPAAETNAEGNVGAMLSLETTSEIVPFASQSSAEVDASNLMQQLLQNRNNQSSFIYDTMTSETGAGVKVIQMSDGTSYSMATQPPAGNDTPEEQCGKEVLYNGVYMYEFTEYQCDMCLLTFASHSATADHVRSSDHSGSTISRNSFCCCLKCSIRYSEKHIMWHHILYLCGNTAEEPADESRLYRCLLCCKAFLSAAFLRRHVCLQHGRQALSAVAGHSHRPLVEASSDGIVRQLPGAPPGLREAQQVVSRLSDYGVGLDGQLLGTWNCFQMNEGGAGITAPTAQDDGALSVFSVPGQETAEANLKTKAGERNGPTGASGSTTVNGETGADSQALLDLACSIVLGGCSPPSTNFTTDGASAPANTSHHPTAPAASASPAAAAAAAPSQSNSAATSNTSSRRTAKGIMYKNVFMQCIVNYLCSTCKKDLSTKASKKEHRSSPCFDADSKRFTYLRQYSYLCPYCSEKFPSQKFCRQHQLSVCLQLMGVKTDELNHKQLLCPFCDRKYFNIITLKGHMTLIHKVNKLESNQILGTSGLLEELISFAPDAAGLSEKAKQAKLKATAEEDRKKVEAKKAAPPPKETALKKAVVPAKGIFPMEKMSEADLKAETGLENNESKANKAKPSGGNLSSSQKPSNELDVENGMSHDSGLESNVAEVTQTTELDGGTKNIDGSELHIVESADPEGLTFDGDTSNDMSTDDPSELDELSCETDNTLPTNDLKESQLDEADETLDGKKSLKRKKSNKKTRRRAVTKTRKKLH